MTLRDFFGFLIFVLMLVVLGAPLALIIQFPGSGEHIAKIATTLIPWLCVLMLFVIFNEGVKQFFSSISHAITRIKRVGTGSAVTEFEVTQKPGASLTDDQIKGIKELFTKIEKEKSAESQFAWMYFTKYIGATIYGSQVELLKDLNDKGPMDASDLISHYQTFLTRAPEGTSYEFNSYMEFLTSNILVNINTETGKYELSGHGKHFLNELDKSGWGVEVFNY